MEEDPFKDLQIDDSSFLDDLQGRTECRQCKRTRKYYCYTCFIPMEAVEGKIPNIKLPLKVDIIKHRCEVDGKSTAAHAAVMASRDVTVYTYPVIPDYTDRHRILLLFPGEKSSTLEQLYERLNSKIDAEQNTSNGEKSLDVDKHGESLPCDGTEKNGAHDLNKTLETSQDNVGDNEVTSAGKRVHKGGSNDEPPVKQRCEDASQRGEDASQRGEDVSQRGEDASQRGDDMSQRFKSLPFDRVVFIDSTWNQTLKIYKDERLQGLQQVEIKSRTTRFWRHQKEKPESYLATIEAIYYFFVDFHELFISKPHSGCYDNLLFFFKFMYGKIRGLYLGGKKLKAYQKKEVTKKQVN